MNRLRKTVLLAAAVLFGAWAAGNFGRITGEQEGVIRFVLGLVLAVLILFRPKPTATFARGAGRTVLVTGVVGAVMALCGIIFRVHQAEWLGLILVLYACLRWSLPDRFSRDVVLSLFLLYWVHPLPGQVFGKFQLLMQLLSVRGSEWLLQCFNVRVWADGFVLYSNAQTFGVPEACSGMRTAVTVFLCTLGVAMVLRFKWYQVPVLLVIGIAQVLLLNIIRISGMVFWAPRMPPQWAGTFLHDTLGLFLLISLLVVQGEASWWKLSTDSRRRRKDAIERGDIDGPERATTLPPFWRIALRRGWIAVVSLLFVAGVAAAVYRSRPMHEAAMIEGVLNNLISRDPAVAEKGVNAALDLDPGNRALLSKRVTILMRRAKYEEALAALDKIPPPLSVAATVLKSGALMELGRLDEAIELIDALPERTRNISGVAMIRAEYAAIKGTPEEVAENVVKAAGTHLLIERVRVLFPYLAAHAQWRAIAQCDSHIPHKRVIPALIAVQANLRVNDLLGAMNILKQALSTWPDEYRFLSSLYAVAVRDPSGEWAESYMDTIMRSMHKLDVETLAVSIAQCFRVGRPDVAWQAYARLKRADPRDPALFLTPAEFADRWLTFRKHVVGLKSASRDEVVNLAPLYRYTRNMRPFASLWNAIPLAEDMGATNIGRARRKYLDRCLGELKRRNDEGRLSPRMEMMYPVALGMADRHDEAHALLDEIGRKYPDRLDRAMFQHAVFYDQQGRWEDSYESLLKYDEVAEIPELVSRLMLVNAMMNMNLGICAMEVIRSGRDSFPGSAELDLAEAAVWGSFGFRERSLQVLSGHEGVMNSIVGVRLLYETGRYKEARKTGQALGLRFKDIAETDTRPFSVVPAEREIDNKWPEPLSGEAMTREAERTQGMRRTGTSPSISGLQRNLVEWYAAKGAGDVSDPDRWLAPCRNDLERSAALHRLAVLLARQQRFEEAIAVAEQAIAMVPRSAILRRILIGLTEGGAEVVEEAVKACPDDPGIWLAALVVRTRDEGPGDWAIEEVRSAIESRTLPPGTMVRAGDFLLRKRMIEAATLAAHDAIDRGRGLVQAHLLGLRCALEQGDMVWALDCALRGALDSPVPGPFYRLVVRIKSLENKTDTDMIAALEYLAEHFPQEPVWAERLGHVYFQKLDSKRALSVLEPALDTQGAKLRVHSLMLAAEAARLEGDLEKAIRILEATHRLHPDRADVLNNLVYCLAHDEEGRARAEELLPLLLEKAGDWFVVLDTAAIVNLKAGKLEMAARYMQKALDMLEKDDYAALEIQLNSAEVQLKMGNYARARAKAEEVRRHPRRTKIVDLRARNLLRRISDEAGPKPDR